MKKIWQKDNLATNILVNKFTVGKDLDFDERLAKYDVKGSMAHCQMLAETGIISGEESKQMLSVLADILKDIESGNFEIDTDAEDIHSQVESILIEKLGDTGKKIHTARSRNDQVLLDIKLYLLDEIREITALTDEFFQILIKLADQHKSKLLPGYTHLQIAMPSSFGLWFGAYAEALLDDVELLFSVKNIINKNPLGSAAGYGSSFPIDRESTTYNLGFQSMNYNSVYAQMTRGKSEKMLSMAMATLAGTLGKFAYDVCLYLSQNFDFISFPKEFTTGSSIMPHKKNPDIFELVRARCNRIQSLPNELILLTNNLPSGYHRDVQLTKEILFPGIDSLKECLEILSYTLPNIQVKDGILEDEKYKYLFSVEKINEEVKKGSSFRDAYVKVGQEIENNEFEFEVGNLQHTHQGSIGNLCLDKIEYQFNKLKNKLLG
ncbi:argininosuccinate lyase [Chryseobacterium carnipullorum]|uniref:Argininosuccinate lyase n=1 Tax=Chryseobacterium carnipullorum TaxID=1124835 RepID=A0A376E3R1_CHRCU|nr:argininosuccinate lyase [Chryseobacterium carnipullorum]AZA50709.1 argininosuccinate lyase [Chryseobacterium carnipullorum]AZA65575.1 argininosuccinate lyase [Chryseobacterium carnipullorum]STD01526.1 Argininosuccinate lyase [Chryseobacterium carnipullorum]